MECGFALYAEHLGDELDSTRSPVRELLYEEARPEWEKLTPHEQQVWTNRAVELARLDARRRSFGTSINYTRKSHLYRSRRYQLAAQRTEDLRRLPCMADDDVEDDEFLTVERSINVSEEGFQFNTLVGPWQIHSDIQRHRAEFHSNETHRIPLTIHSTQMDKRQLVTEILERCEPDIPIRQGMQFGLYSGEILGFPCQEHRYVLADAFLYALADCLKGKALADAQAWLSALGEHLPENVRKNVASLF
ncbi:hypothetical protein KIN20_024386 [Parelaphostrongylus tenuis]|uniref:Maelstrom domain-containing protein n=1 Tax=Parelaphostrongylus tenuis TaxID=148309 RepID=A0AAD5QVY8_PARTN|nr:hypothetical protein KIN20_024386 [Parelaphostrongylus tenuis]